MKNFLVFVFLSFSVSVMSQELPSFKVDVSEVPRDVLAMEQIKVLKARFAAIDSFCDVQLSGFFDEILACKTTFKSKVRAEIYAWIDQLLQADLKLGREKAVADLEEQKCIEFIRKQLDSLVISYNPSDNCQQLKARLPVQK